MDGGTRSTVYRPPLSIRCPSNLIPAARACASRPSARASASTSATLFFSGRFRVADHAHAPEEIVHAQPAEEPRRAAGGQHVRRAGQVIAERLGRVRAHEDRAGGPDFLQQIVRVPTASSRCSGANWFARATAWFRSRVTAMKPYRSSHRARPSRARASANCRSSSASVPRATRKSGVQQHGGGRIVLGLAEQIGRDESRIGFRVGDDEHLARPGEHVERDFAVHLALGQRDEDVSGADDFVHAADGLRPVGERRDRMGAADAIDLGHSQAARGGERLRPDGPVGPAGRDDGDSLTPATMPG